MRIPIVTNVPNGVELEIRRGFGTKSWSSARVRLPRLPRRRMGDLLLLLDQIASRVTE
jgi:hypothetical protein